MTEAAPQKQDRLFAPSVTAADDLVGLAEHVPQLDLVCSQYVLAEREKLYKRPAEERCSIMADCFVKRSFPLMLTLVGFGILQRGLYTLGIGKCCGRLFEPEQDPLNVLCVYLMIGESIALPLYAVYRLWFKPFPTNVMVSPAGLRFAWRFKQSEAIPWSAIKDIHAMYKPGVGLGHGPQEIVLRFEIDKNELSVPQKSGGKLMLCLEA